MKRSVKVFPCSKVMTYVGAVCLSAAFFLSVSCSSEESLLTEDQTETAEWTDLFAGYPRLNEIGFSDVETKVQYEGLVTEDDVRLYKSSFEAGDIIYVCVANEEGVQQYKYKYVSPGKKWEVAEGEPAAYVEDAEYFAYWNGQDIDLSQQENELGQKVIPTVWDSSKGDDSLTGVNGFFRRAIHWWAVGGARKLDVRNQYTEELFRGQDLMTGKADYVGNNCASFTLYHAMGLACIEHGVESSTEVTTVKELSTDPHYCWKESTVYEKIVSYDGNVSASCRPYYPGEGAWDYLWVSPKEAASQTLITADNSWSRTLSIGTAKFKRIKLHKSIIFPREQYTIENGDILYSDGTLSHNAEIDTKDGLRTPVGIVVSLDANCIDDLTAESIMNSQAAYSGKIETEESGGQTFEVKNRGYDTEASSGTGFHALVLALDDAANENTSGLSNVVGKVKWCVDNTSGSSVKNRTKVERVLDDVSSIESWTELSEDNVGYSNTKAVWGLSDYKSDNYPAFGYVKEYGETVPVSTGDITSTEWFLPSAGQWIYLSKGLLKCSMEGLYINKNGSDVGDIKDLKNLEDPSGTLAEWAVEEGDDTHGFSLLGDEETIPALNEKKEPCVWVIYDIPEEYILQTYLQNAGADSDTDISPAGGGVVYWTSSQGGTYNDANGYEHGLAVTFCPGGGSVKELTLGWDHAKDNSFKDTWNGYGGGFFPGGGSGNRGSWTFTNNSTVHRVRAMLAF